MRPEGIKTGRKTSWAALVALFLAPLLIVGALLGLAGGADDERITAAIVNLDEGTEVQGQFVPMGRQLGAEMIGRDGDNIRWILADEQRGAERLRTGEYAAVVTIPKDFSERVMSFSANDAATAEKANVQIAVSRNAPAFDGDLPQEIARIAMESLNDTLTGQYLDGIYKGFNEVGVQFQQIVDGAEQLHDGAGQLTDGLGQATDGAAQLADGMDQLTAAAGPITSGGEQLVAGGSEVTSGASQLADGASELDAGVQQMAAQMPQLTSGVQQLVDGANQLLPRVGEYTDGAQQVVGGVDQLRSGLDQMVTGIDAGTADLAQLRQLADGAQQVADGVDQLVTPLEQLDGIITDDMIAQAKALRTQIGDFAEFVEGLEAQLQGYADGSLPLPMQVTDAAAQLKASFRCTVEDPQACEQQRAAFEEGVDQALSLGFRQGAQRGLALLHGTDPATGKTYYELAVAASGQVNAALDQIVGGLEQAQQAIPQLRLLRDGAQQVADGVDQVATQMPAQMGQLRDGLVQLRDGAAQIVEQSQPLVTGGRQLADGADQLNAGIQQLGGQLGALPAGVRQLADGTAQLADGAGELGDGVGQYVDGVGQFADGVGQYVDGVDQAGAGAGDLADGMTQLGDGAGELTDGLGTFADKLADGKEQLPNYSASDRETLADVVSSPIGVGDGLMARGAVPLSAIILVAALWLASLGAFTIARPVPSDVVTSRRSNLVLWLRTTGVPTGIVAASGAVLGLVGGAWWHMSFGRTVGLMAVLAFLGVVFSLAHHALTGWLGHVGRAISLVLLAVTVALGLSSGLPGWLDVVASISPVHSGMLLVRSFLAGAPVVTSVGLMVFVGAVMAALSWLAIAARRRLTPAAFRLHYA